MTDEEINGIAEGMTLYLREHAKTSIDGMNIMIFILLNIYEGRPPNNPVTFEEFMEEFKRQALNVHRLNTAALAQGTETLQ